MVWSGNPPAIFVQVIIRCVTAKAGAWGASAPHVFIFWKIRHLYIRLIINFYIFLDYFPIYPLKVKIESYIIHWSMHFSQRTIETIERK